MVDPFLFEKFPGDSREGLPKSLVCQYSGKATIGSTYIIILELTSSVGANTVTGPSSTKTFNSPAWFKAVTNIPWSSLPMATSANEAANALGVERRRTTAVLNNILNWYKK